LGVSRRLAGSRRRGDPYASGGKYKEAHYPIEASDPIADIKIRMEELGMKQEDLVPYMGKKGTKLRNLNRKRTLSLGMIKSLHRGFPYPQEVLIAKPGIK
jgi:HTH-type transcriptional regulator / antitoxin HigA